jgi:cytochrome c peroxidase
VFAAAAAAGPIPETRVTLGRYLFHDARLSVNGTQSCASCHRQELAFNDGRATARGATKEEHPRSATSLVNIGASTVPTRSDPSQRSLEQQALVPMFALPVELGLKGMEPRVLRMLRTDPVYQDLFPKAFTGETAPFTLANVTRAIAAFERSYKDSRMKPIALAPRNRADLIEFLRSLTDDELLHDPRFGNPWEQQST